MYALLLVLIVLLFLLLKARETFALHVGGNDWYNFDVDGQGTEILQTTPNSCPPDRPELDGGLCYPRCREGYHGVGPVCWVNSYNRGAGTVIGLEPCPDGWSNDGLICREPIGCHSIGDCFMHGQCGCWGGRLKGRLDGGGVCPGPQGNEYTEKQWGMCYKKCPKDYPVTNAGVPYLCLAASELSYGRGVGKVPPIVRVGGKYTFGQF
jgi:hypothetical protein